MKTQKIRILMYWICAKYRLFHMIEDNLGMKVNSVYYRLYRSKGRTDFVATAIANEINRLKNFNIDLATMCKQCTEEESEIILSKI